jgi:hypothetical protein
VGGEVSVRAYYDDLKSTSVDIFRSAQPEGALFATIGLMAVDQSRNPGVQIHSEILMDRRDGDEQVANILATVAFYIMKTGWRVAPGIVFEEMLRMYFPDHPLPHILFVPPFQWRSAMAKVPVGDSFIYPLVGVPISEEERVFAASQEDRALEHLWESQHVDVLDWGRPSAV